MHFPVKPNVFLTVYGEVTYSEPVIFLLIFSIIMITRAWRTHNLFCKRARGHERGEIKQTTVAKEAFVNVKTHHWLVKFNLRYSRTFCQLCSSTWHLDILDSNPAGFKTV